MKKERVKSVGRSSSGRKSTGIPAIVIGDASPKRWDNSRQRSKSIDPRRSTRKCDDGNEDEFMKMAHSSLSRGSDFFNQGLDDDDQEPAESMPMQVPMDFPTPSAKECAPAKSIPWDTFLHKATAETKLRSR